MSMDQVLSETQLPADVTYVQTAIVNVVLYGTPSDKEWTLIDAGVTGFAAQIAQKATKHFGSAKPRAIILTHGHFDHVGSLFSLLEQWGDVPIYAGRNELPFLQGVTDYPPGDPSVGGGLLAEIAPLYPHKAINLGNKVQELPEDGSVPSMEGWRWISTPGHTPGHISLFRETDRTLIAGDAFITVKQESAMAVMTQELDIHGPPMYFTPNWDQARASVQQLESLKPAYAITGHGRPISGDTLSQGLLRLAQDFDRLAIPDQGKYVHQ
jgi:glyoxylase-like metal-dependent hydrolase (beta-lactamase superfamily II)